MDMFNTIWDLAQQGQIYELKQDVKSVSEEARSEVRQTIDQTYLPYVKQLDKLGLVCQAMWSLLQEKTGLTEKDLLQRVTELDLKDGVLDGKYNRLAPDCPSCGAKMCRKFNRCLFCGREYTEGSVFDTV